MKNRHLTFLFTLGALALLATLVPTSARAQAPAQSAPAKPLPAGEIVARVNDQVITLAEYQKAEQQLRDEVTHDCQGCPPEKIDAQFKEQQKDLLRGLIDQALMVQRAKDMGIKVDSDASRTASPPSRICKKASKLPAFPGRITRPRYAIRCFRKKL
jgi:parvulin-like peptidyl-prolyl isomerase